MRYHLPVFHRYRSFPCVLIPASQSHNPPFHRFTPVQAHIAYRAILAVSTRPAPTFADFVPDLCVRQLFWWSPWIKTALRLHGEKHVRNPYAHHFQYLPPALFTVPICFLLHSFRRSVYVTVSVSDFSVICPLFFVVILKFRIPFACPVACFYCSFIILFHPSVLAFVAWIFAQLVSRPFVWNWKPATSYRIRL